MLQLAQSHKIASEVLDKDAKFGPGKLHISLGDKSFTLDVQGNSKLVDIVRGINGEKSNPGVRASIINDVEGPRLIVASNVSGKDHSVKCPLKRNPVIHLSNSNTKPSNSEFVI